MNHAVIAIAALIAAGAALAPSSASAAATGGSITVWREVPVHHALSPKPQGYAYEVDTSPDDTVRNHAPGPKLLDDETVANVTASTPDPAKLTTSDVDTHVVTVQQNNIASGNDITAAGTESFSSLGGSVSGQVVDAVTRSLEGLTSALGGAR